MTKKLSIFIFVITTVLILTPATFFAYYDNPLIGTWDATHANWSFLGEPFDIEIYPGEMVMQLHPDGTGSLSHFGLTDDFTWSSDNGTVRIDSISLWLDNEYYEYSIYGDTLTLIFSDDIFGSTITFQRSQESNTNTPEINDSLVGRWEGISSEWYEDGDTGTYYLRPGELIFEFFSDGTGTIVDDDRSDNLTWFSNDGILTIRFETLPEDWVTRTTDEHPYSLENDIFIFTIIDRSGTEVITFHRIESTPDIPRDTQIISLPSTIDELLIGRWSIFSLEFHEFDGELIREYFEGYELTMIFHANGTGSIREWRGEVETFTWSANNGVLSLFVEAYGQIEEFGYEIYDGAFLFFVEDRWGTDIFTFHQVDTDNITTKSRDTTKLDTTFTI